MSARIISLPRELAWPLRSDIKTSLVCWGSYLVLLTGYCLLYQAVVDRVTPNVTGSIVDVCKNWGVWLLTTPVIFSACRKYAAKRGDRAIEFVAFCMGVLVASAAVPVAIDLLTGARDATTSLMIFLPRYIAAMGVMYLVWHVFLRERFASDAAEIAAPLQQDQPEHEYDRERDLVREPAPAPVATLLVSKGADQCLIQVSRIECVSAAGNYVEIVERGQRYLMRATMKQVEEMLPPADFIRIHRSHLVRRDEIERIRTQPSGNGTVQLRGGQVLPMSKKHKHELQRYRAPE